VKKVPALELRNVSYVANGKRILDSVSWMVGEAEHWAILGPNGAGKTTLLRLACGYLWPNAGGEVYRKGKLLLNLRELRKSIGWVTSTLPNEIPAWEKVIRTVVSGKFAQVGLFEGFGGRATKTDYALATTYLKQMRCAELQDREFGMLSQGEQQKVLVARARMTKPYLIMLDEPCAGMDPGAREKFLASLQQLGKQKKIPALIYVTHHIEEILPIFKKVLILKDGKALRSGAKAAVLNGNVLNELYGVRLEIIKRHGRFWPLIK
jgi:iron complex transport system ATP-binding protein